MKYPNLVAYIKKRKISMNVMSKHLNITIEALEKKINGEKSFKWNEACEIQKVFFPDKTKDFLFLEF